MKKYNQRQNQHPHRQLILLFTLYATTSFHAVASGINLDADTLRIEVHAVADGVHHDALMIQCDLFVNDQGEPLAETWRAVRHGDLLATAPTFGDLHARLEAPASFLFHHLTRNKNGDLLSRSRSHITLSPTLNAACHRGQQETYP